MNPHTTEHPKPLEFNLEQWRRDIQTFVEETNRELQTIIDELSPVDTSYDSSRRFEASQPPQVESESQQLNQTQERLNSLKKKLAEKINPTESR